MSSFKQKKEEKYVLKKSDIDFYKMTGVLAIASVFIMLVLKMQSSSGISRAPAGSDMTENFYKFCRTPLFFVIAGVAAVAAVVWFAVCRVKKIDESKRIFTSLNCLAVVAYLGFFSACFGLVPDSKLHGFFVSATVVMAILYYISKIFYADFIMYSVITGVFCGAIYLFKPTFEPLTVALRIAFILICAVCCVYFHKRMNKLKISKKTKAAFIKFPIYVPLVLGSLFLFWAYFQNKVLYTNTQNNVLLTLYNIVFLNRTKMLVIMMVQYIAFAIVYTVRRIKD
ncbi:MAG: hypothetical protein E7600_07720 [Ruminococcaceae bacterium]|nr:hypothetical protein [Oscillospiraceae bacterium]